MPYSGASVDDGGEGCDEGVVEYDAGGVVGFIGCGFWSSRAGTLYGLGVVGLGTGPHRLHGGTCRRTVPRRCELLGSTASVLLPYREAAGDGR